MPTQLLLLRHGQSTWNAENRWQGWSDPPLSPIGKEQAAEAAGHLVGAGITGVASSDLVRARETAGTIAARFDLGEVVIEPAIREYNVGDWEGLTRPEIELRWPEELVAWQERRLLSTPGGEARSAFLERITAGLERLAALPSLGEMAVIVTHGGVIRAVERLTEADRTISVGNLAGRWFTVEDGGRLWPGDFINLLDPEHRTSAPSL